MSGSRHPLNQVHVIVALLLCGIGSWRFLVDADTTTEATELTSSPNDDIPDEATGLTPREKRAVRKSWDLVKEDYKGHGIALFVKFFKTYPDYQQKFQSFKNVPVEKLPENPRVHAHAAAVLYAITSLIDNLDDIECLKEMLLKLGHNHFKRTVTVKHFENLAVVIIDFMKETFGSQMLPGAEEGWKKVFIAINTLVGMGLEQAQKEKN